MAHSEASEWAQMAVAGGGRQSHPSHCTGKGQMGQAQDRVQGDKVFVLETGCSQVPE